jgi:DNA-binding NarL/FixJ family response regulator
MKTILIVDDDEDLRFMLKHLIHSATDLEVIGEAGDGNEAIDMARRYDPDLVIMDAAMPNLDGVEATRQIRDAHPRAYILGLTAFADYPEMMLGAGANQVLMKTEAYGNLTKILMSLKSEEESGEPWYI